METLESLQKRLENCKNRISCLQHEKNALYKEIFRRGCTVQPGKCYLWEPYENDGRYVYILPDEEYYELLYLQVTDSSVELMSINDLTMFNKGRVIEITEEDFLKVFDITTHYLRDLLKPSKDDNDNHSTDSTEDI